jgi:hypothetical protein
MTIHGDLGDVIRGELDDVERAIKRGDATRALRLSGDVRFWTKADKAGFPIHDG